jgi:hypothetical protein
MFPRGWRRWLLVWIPALLLMPALRDGSVDTARITRELWFWGPMLAFMFVLRWSGLKAQYIVLDARGMAWCFEGVRQQATWGRIERVTVDPYTESAHVQIAGRARPVPLELGELTLEDHEAVLRWLAERERLHEGPALAEEGTPVSPPRARDLPWSALGLGPGMMVGLAMGTCALFCIGLLAALQGVVVPGVVLLALVPILLTRCWFRAFVADEVGLRLRRWPLGRTRVLPWGTIEDVRGGTDVRPLRLKTRDGAHHRTGVALTRGEFGRLHATWSARGAAAVFG